MISLVEFYTDTSKNIKYDNLIDVELDEKGKPTRSWMWQWSQEERTQKFFEFCRAYDEREDSLLRDNYQQFSHRLHWHECPFVDTVSQINDTQKVLNSCMLFSFTNEHWLTFYAWLNGSDEGLKNYIDDGNRPCRSDLFQIYYPKDTDVKKWLLEVPKQTAEDLHSTLMRNDRRYSMMEYAKLLNEYLVTKHGFRNAMYPCKNAARHIAMSHPEWVDPESFLHGGTGFFDGLTQVFDCPSYMSKAKYSIQERNGAYIPLNEACSSFLEKMMYLERHTDNPIREQKYLNLEDKLCFFYKHIAITKGVKQTTKQIPYSWVYPENWSLRTGKYDS